MEKVEGKVRKMAMDLEKNMRGEENEKKCEKEEGRTRKRAPRMKLVGPTFLENRHGTKTETTEESKVWEIHLDGFPGGTKSILGKGAKGDPGKKWEWQLEN